MLQFLKLTYLARCKDRRNRELFKNTETRAMRGESGSIFEMEMLKAIQFCRTRELELERLVSPSSRKRVDFFFPSVGFGFELIAPSRQAVPTVFVDVDISPTESEFNNAIRGANCQGETLATLVNSKCGDKDFSSLAYPVVLLFDLATNDIFEDFFHDTNFDRFRRICLDFNTFLNGSTLQNQRRDHNHWAQCNNVGLALIERKKKSKPKFWTVSPTHSSLTTEAINTAIAKSFNARFGQSPL